MFFSFCFSGLFFYFIFFLHSARKTTRLQMFVFLFQGFCLLFEGAAANTGAEPPSWKKPRSSVVVVPERGERKNHFSKIRAVCAAPDPPAGSAGNAQNSAAVLAGQNLGFVGAQQLGISGVRLIENLRLPRNRPAGFSAACSFLPALPVPGHQGASHCCCTPSLRRDLLPGLPFPDLTFDDVHKTVPLVDPAGRRRAPRGSQPQQSEFPADRVAASAPVGSQSSSLQVELCG